MKMKAFDYGYIGCCRHKRNQEKRSDPEPRVYSQRRVDRGKRGKQSVRPGRPSQGGI